MKLIFRLASILTFIMGLGAILSSALNVVMLSILFAEGGVAGEIKNLVIYGYSFSFLGVLYGVGLSYLSYLLFRFKKRFIYLNKVYLFSSFFISLIYGFWGALLTKENIVLDDVLQIGLFSLINLLVILILIGIVNKNKELFNEESNKKENEEEVEIKKDN